MLNFFEGENANGGGSVVVGRIISAAVVGALLAWALVLALRAVEPCQVPREWDSMRDISIAQALLDGGYPEDPVLRGEISWYNPMTGVILCVLHHLTGLSLMRLAVIAGPFLNLLAPAAFYFLVAGLFGRGAGLAGLLLVLFGKDGALPLWTCAYSPWLLASVYALGLLFLTLAFFFRAFCEESPRFFFLTGVLLGVTFLSHTAPAIVAGGTMSLMTLWEVSRLWFRERKRHEARMLALHFLAALCIAFFVSLPFSGPILWRYQFHVLNPWPSLYAFQNVELENLPAQIRQAFSVRNGIALIGLLTLFRHRNRPEVRLTACWALVVCALLVQHYLWQALKVRGVVITGLVPGHHAGIHLAAVRTLLFGVGVVSLGILVGAGVAWAWRKISGRDIGKSLLYRVTAALAVIACALILYGSNPYEERIDFKPPGGTAYFDLYERYLPMYAWIRDNTPAEAVFLCPAENLGVQVVMPAGRKLVNPMLLYSNPYVDRGKLTLRQDVILKAMEAGNREELCKEAEIFPLLFLLLEETADKQLPFTTERYRAGGTVLYEVHPCWETVTR